MMYFPNILQSVLIVLMMGIAHTIGNALFSFIEHDNLIMMLNELFKCGLLFWFMRYLVRAEYIERLEFSLKNMDIGVLVSGIVGVITLSYFPLPEVSLFEDNTIERYVGNAIENRVDVFSFAYMVLIAPVFEETVFRGIIQRGLSTRYSPVVAILVTSMLFALLHLTLIGTLLFSVFVGWIYYRTQNIVYSVLIHATMNAIGFGTRFAISKEYIIMENLNSSIESNKGLLALVFSIVLAGALYRLYKTLYKRKDNEEVAYL